MATKSFVQKWLNYVKNFGRTSFAKVSNKNGERFPTVAEQGYQGEEIIVKAVKNEASSNFFQSRRTQTLASLLMKRFAFRTSGRNGTLFAFVVGLAMSPEQSIKEDVKNEEEWETFIASNKARPNEAQTFNIFEVVQKLSLEELQLGNVIGQGCNAAVHEARLRSDMGNADKVEGDILLNDEKENSNEHDMTPEDQTEEKVLSVSSNKEKEIVVEEDRDVHEDDMIIISDVPCNELDQSLNDEKFMDLDFCNETEILMEEDQDVFEDDIIIISDMPCDESDQSLYDGDVTDFDFCNDVVSLCGEIAGGNENTDGGFEDDIIVLDKQSDPDDEKVEGRERTVSLPCPSEQKGVTVCTKDVEFPLAVKVFFNYQIESNAELIFRAMKREFVPARKDVKDRVIPENSPMINTRVRLKSLPDHPNIVQIFGVFVDTMETFPGAVNMYPVALPGRICTDGIGHNKTMFMVMKRYTSTLDDYLKQKTPTLRTRCLLLSQLLEGVWHINRNEIAHRDIKSNNIFVDCKTEGDTEIPCLVIGDFGCCLADPENGLHLPFATDATDRGGNIGLMAPEIINARPGKNVWLDYTKADLWACGTMIYEIFGCDNPFSKAFCCSETYSETDLPPLPENCPKVLDFLRKHLLKKSPAERMDHQNAVNLINMYLWFPSWLQSLPTKQSVCQQLAMLSVGIGVAKVMRDVACQPEWQAQELWLENLKINVLMENLKQYHFLVNC